MAGQYTSSLFESCVSLSLLSLFKKILRALLIEIYKQVDLF